MAKHIIAFVFFEAFIHVTIEPWHDIFLADSFVVCAAQIYPVKTVEGTYDKIIAESMYDFAAFFDRGLHYACFDAFDHLDLVFVFFAGGDQCLMIFFKIYDERKSGIRVIGIIVIGYCDPFRSKRYSRFYHGTHSRIAVI